MKINLIKEELSRSRKSSTKTKTKSNSKGLFIMTPGLFNRLEFTKNLKSNEG